jgi:transcription initiation factor IIE alpha subunit
MAHYANLDPVLDLIEAQRRQVHESAGAAIREVEARREQELSQLERAAVALGGKAKAAASGGRGESPPPARTPRRRPRRKGKSSVAAAAERRKAVLDYLAGRQELVAPAEICRALRITRHEARTALLRLYREGLLTRVGTGRATRYGMKAEAPVRSLSAVPSARLHGTFEGLLLETIEDRGSASAEELAQASGASLERVEKACGALIVEGHIRMGRRDNRPVYVWRRAA